MLSEKLEEHMKNFINKFNGGTKINNKKRIGNITEDQVRYFLYITVLILNAAITIKHKDLMKLNVSKILNGDCEPGFLNLMALSPISPISLPQTCQNYMVIKSAMKQVLSSNVIEFIYPVIIFFAGLIASGSYMKMNDEIINTIVSTIFSRVKTDHEKDEEKQKNMENHVIGILNKMNIDKSSNKNQDIATEALLLLNQQSNDLITSNKIKKKTNGGKSKKKRTNGGKSKKKRTNGGKSKKKKSKKID